MCVYVCTGKPMKVGTYASIHTFGLGTCAGNEDLHMVPGLNFALIHKNIVSTNSDFNICCILLSSNK